MDKVCGRCILVSNILELSTEEEIEIITWQELDIVFIHEFTYHSANERVFERVSGMIRKRVNKTISSSCHAIICLLHTFSGKKLCINGADSAEIQKP